jgi:hypothetical protein
MHEVPSAAAPLNNPFSPHTPPPPRHPTPPRPQNDAQPPRLKSHRPWSDTALPDGKDITLIGPGRGCWYFSAVVLLRAVGSVPQTPSYIDGNADPLARRRP